MDSSLNDVETKKLKEAIKVVDELIAAAQKFIDKVESGRAYSKETYRELKSALIKLV